MPKTDAEKEQEVKHVGHGLKDAAGQHKTDKKDDWFGPAGKPTKKPTEGDDK